MEYPFPFPTGLSGPGDPAAMTDSAPDPVQFLNSRERAPAAFGAYGFRLSGVNCSPELLVVAPSGWPVLDVSLQFASAVAPAPEFGDTSARLPLRTGGFVEFEREPLRASLTVDQAVPQAAIIHPLLGVAVAVPAYWLGRDSFHAAAFVVEGGAWAVIAEREAGKSSLVASLALAGVPIVCDDILVLDRAAALAGPRSVDLREPAAVALGVGEPLGRVGDRNRWRMALPQVEPVLPLRGWVTLEWGEEVTVRPVRGAERLRRIAAQRAFLLRAPDPAGLLELSSLPVLELTRPRRWDATAATIDRLLEAVSAARAELSASSGRVLQHARRGRPTAAGGGDRERHVAEPAGEWASVEQTICDAGAQRVADVLAAQVEPGGEAVHLERDAVPRWRPRTPAPDRARSPGAD